MNPFALHINSVISICLVSQLLCFATSSAAHRVLRKVPENALQLKESTTTVEPDSDDIDDVFAIPIDDFRDYWYGRRLRKRSLLSFDEENDLDKRSQYQPWGGKRAHYLDIFQVPKGFNPNGGKRSDNSLKGKPSQLDNSRKRTSKAFQNWAGKRSNNGKQFVIWGGKKRADTFRTWAGKRADSFRTWGGKRADSFRTWGGKRSE